MSKTPIDAANALTWLSSQPWAVQPMVLNRLITGLQSAMRGDLTQDALAEALRAAVGLPEDAGDPLDVDAAVPGEPGRARAVAVIPVRGLITQRPSLFERMFGVSLGTTTEGLVSQVREAVNAPEVTAVVLDYHSPGGSVYGVPEAFKSLMAMRGGKPIIAIANAQAFSAAYWLAAAADEIVVTPSGEVGSIGVWTAHVDYSKALQDMGMDVTLIRAGKFKVEDNPWEPLSDDARGKIQKDVNAYYGMFISAVARGRGVSQPIVRGGYGEGRTVMAADAKAEGMVDRIATFDETMARLGVRPMSGRPTRAEAPDEQDIRPEETEIEDAEILETEAAEGAVNVSQRHRELDLLEMS